MLERKVKVELEHGLHARPATEFVKLCASVKSDVTLIKDKKEMNAKSIMGVMALGVSKGDQVTLRVNGPDEAEAIEKLEKYLMNGEKR
ncbi:HPr family phosphocarrier protein [Thermicanus aegyptius]|uniref:HPr family phosphocarrier protein n=1 Tax=Thermicanus aegyptius TaxID=94009 RepID=UPI00041BAC8E|nr:HPr family phosphocarrier protein [Thermicanus aegyptius]